MNALEFTGRLHKVTRTADGWSACCPAHEDSNASLSISEGTDRRVLLHCHAGCKPDEICRKLGIKLADLFTEKRNGSNLGTIVATYDYTDADGKLLFQCTRHDPKDFRQRQPNGAGGWTWSLKGIDKPVLFHLPKLAKAANVIVCEGEKDVLRVEQEGFTATCNPMGAGKWRGWHSDTLRGKCVCVVADKDKPGREHAEQVARSLQGKASFVSVIELPDVNGHVVKDAADFFAAGGTKAQFAELVSNAEAWKPSVASKTLLDEYMPEAEECNACITPDLPEIIDAADFISEPLTEPPQLIQGVLHQGSKLVLGGGSKSFKTWTLLDLALSVAHGQPWLSFGTAQGRVLFLNFEIQPWSWQKRIQKVAESKGVKLEPGRVSLWNLRGKAAAFDKLLPQVIEHAKGYALIVLDPVYKLYGNADENKTTDVARLLNAIEDLAVQTGAAVAFGAHFSKGNQAGKESIDRISGSGVFARDPDSLLIFTRHETDDAFTVEATLRNFPAPEPFVVRWQFPLMTVDSELDPSRLKKAGGRKREHTAEDLLGLLDSGSMTTRDWRDAAENEAGIKERTFYSLLGELQKSNRVLKSAVNRRWARVQS
jgi:5S rRNA maturation endonuclease (ribonuclease M5)